MYNGIGLQTPRGSGTNGHVQRNWAFVRPGKKDNVAYKTEEDISKLEASLNRQPNKAILDHERKRKIEVKCAEFEEILEKQGYDAETIKSKIESYRAKLLGQGKGELPKDEFGRVAVRETHQVAEAQQEKNAKLREAFGISEYFVEGTSFDPDRKAKEELAKSAALQEDVAKETEKDRGRKYALVRTPSPEKNVQKPKKDSSEKKKKKRKHRDTSSSPDRKKEKKKKSKKHKKERSKKKKAKKRKEKDSDSDYSGESDSDKDSIDSEDEKKRKKAKKEKKKKERKRKERSASVESRSVRVDKTKSSQKKTREKDSSSKKSGENEPRDRNNDEKQKKANREEHSMDNEFAKNNPFSNKIKNSDRNPRRSQSLNAKRAHSLSPSYRNTDSKSSQKRRPRSRSRGDKTKRNDSRSSLEEEQTGKKKKGDIDKGLKPQKMPHTPEEKNSRRKAESTLSSSLERSHSRTRDKRRRTPDERRLSVSRKTSSSLQNQKRSSQDRSVSPGANETKRRKRPYRDSRSRSHSIDKQRNARKHSITKEKSPKRIERQHRSIGERSISRSPSAKKERVNPFRTGNNRYMQPEPTSISPRGDRQRNSPYLSNKRYGYRGRRKSFSRSPSRSNRYSPPIRSRRSLSREGSRDKQSTRPRTKSPKIYKSSRPEDSQLRRDCSSSHIETKSQRNKSETCTQHWRDRKKLESKSPSPKKDRYLRDNTKEATEDRRPPKNERSTRQDPLSRSPHKQEVRSKSPSNSRSRSPCREDFLKSPSQKTSKVSNSAALQNKAQPTEKSPLQSNVQQDRKVRSNSSSSESSDLSYSPARRDPERYRALLEQVKKETKEKGALKSPKKGSPSSKRNRSKSKDNRRSQNIHPQPRVHLHSNESDGSDGNESANEETRNRNVEKFIDAIVNEKKDESQKCLQKDMEMLEALKSGIAAKAKEKIKTIEKMATEINEPAPLAQTTLLPLNETNLVEAIVAKVTNSTAVAAVAAAVAAEKKPPRSRSQSKHKIDSRRSRSGSRSSFTSTSSSSSGSSRSRSRSSDSSRSSRSSRSRSSSSATSGARSRSRSRSATRSPSIPRRRGSPSFLDRRRITSTSKYRR